MKRKKSLIVVTTSAVIIAAMLAGAYWMLNKLSSGGEQVASVVSMIQKQHEAEGKFELSGHSLDEPKVIVNPYDNSPLTALVAFETKSEVAPTVTIRGRDDLSSFSHEFEASKIHYLPIYGLYPGQTNQVEIIAGDETKIIDITTDQLPDNMILPIELTAQKDKLSNELYFFSPSSAGGYTVAYDVNGDVRWYLTERATWKIGRLANGHLLISTDRLVNPPYYTTGLYEMDLLGKVYIEYSLEGGYHHDYYEMERGNLLIASDDFTSEAGTVEDIVVEMDRQTGEIVKRFDLKELLNTEDGKSESWTDYDWFHNNSVWYDKRTNSITLSGRHQDAVINIDYDDGKLNWIIGDPTNWSEAYQKYFFKPVGDLEWQWSQHAAMITPEGYVFILDNGNNKSKIKDNYTPASESYTRGVIYKIDTEKMTIEQVWQYGKERGSEFYSPYISDVDYLKSGHYIVHSGGIVYKDGQIQNTPAGLAGADKLVSDTVELINDEVVFELKLPTNNYRVEKMSLYATNENFRLGQAERFGSLGKTPTTTEKTGFILSSIQPGDVFSTYDIRLEREVDRLVFSGRFKKDDEVKVILHQGMQQLSYDVRVSKKPYTALCVDIFTDEEKEKGLLVTKYFNAEGLSGKYSLFVEINGRLYNTDKFVRF